MVPYPTPVPADLRVRVTAGLLRVLAQTMPAPEKRRSPQPWSDGASPRYLPSSAHPRDPRRYPPCRGQLNDPLVFRRVRPRFFTYLRDGLWSTVPGMHSTPPVSRL
jgi:hypothetical protein